MRVRVKFVKIPNNIFGSSVVDVIVNEGATVKDVIIELVKRYKDKLHVKEQEYVDKLLSRTRIILNDKYSNASAKVNDGDLIMLVALAAGG